MCGVKRSLEIRGKRPETDILPRPGRPNSLSCMHCCQNPQVVAQMGGFQYGMVFPTPFRYEFRALAVHAAPCGKCNEAKLLPQDRLQPTSATAGVGLFFCPIAKCSATLSNNPFGSIGVAVSHRVNQGSDRGKRNKPLGGFVSHLVFPGMVATPTNDSSKSRYLL